MISHNSQNGKAFWRATTEPTGKDLLDQARARPACPEQRRGQLADGMPSRPIGYLLHRKYKRNVVLVSSHESAIRGTIAGLEHDGTRYGGAKKRAAIRWPARFWYLVVWRMPIPSLA